MKQALQQGFSSRSRWLLQILGLIHFPNNMNYPYKKENPFTKYFNILKWVWLVFIIAFVGLYLHKNFNKAGDVFMSLPASYLAASFIMLLSGKLLLSFSMLLSLKYVSIDLPFWKCFRTYNFTQISKYIPGSIWQFVSRISLYSKDGMNAQEIRTSMILEMFWLLSSAFIIGTAVVLLTEHELFLNIYRAYTKSVHLVFTGAIAVTALVTIKIKKSISGFLKFIKHWKLNIAMGGVQTCVWILFGLSFAFIVEPFLSDKSTIIYIIGLYAIAWLTGFLTPFAQAGIGIREGVLALGLSLYLTQETAIILAGMSRIMYLLIEIVLVLVAVTLSEKKIKNLS